MVVGRDNIFSSFLFVFFLPKKLSTVAKKKSSDPFSFFLLQKFKKNWKVFKSKPPIMNEDGHAALLPPPPAVSEDETQTQMWLDADLLSQQQQRQEEVADKVRALVDETMEDNAESLHWKMKHWKQYVGEHLNADALASLTKSAWSDIVTGVAMNHLRSQDMTQESQLLSQESQEVHSLNPTQQLLSGDRREETEAPRDRPHS